MAKQFKTFVHHYPSDLTDRQWQLLEPLLKLDPDEPARVYNMRDICDALFYLDRTGCAWRYLPENLPPWQNVQYYFYKWTRERVLERCNAVLAKLVRKKAGRRPQPSAGSIDAQSVKTTEKRGIQSPVVTTLAKRLRDASAMHLSTPLGSS